MKKLITLFIIVFFSQFLMAQTIKQRLDSITNQDFYEGAWITTNAYVYKYDILGNQTQEKYLILNEDGGMDILKQTDYSYYPNHTLSQLILSTIDENNYPEVIEAYKENIDYNDDGLIDQKIISYKNPITLQWELNEKINFEYDEFKNLILRIDSSSSGCVTPEWEPNRRNEYNYNTNNNLITHLVYSWTDEQWRDHDKFDYSYNEEGELIQEIRSTRFGLPDWKEERKLDYEYDDSGNKIQIIYSSFSELNTWLVTEKINLSYDDWNNMIQYIGYSWDDNQWNKAYKRDWEMNTDYAYNELILPYFDDGENLIDDGIGLHPIGTFEQCFNYMLNESFGFKWNDGSWSNINHSSFHYSQFYTGIENVSENTIHIFPNPASDFIEFNIGDETQSMTFKLFDLNGKLVINKEVSSANRTSVNGFKNGMYFYQLISNSVVWSGKVMIQ